MANLVLFLAVFLLVPAKALAQAWQDPVCADVAWDFLPCMNFLQGIGQTPSWGCCEQLKDLNKIAEQKEGRERICLCIEELVFEDGELLSSRAGDLSNKCQEKIGFPISNGMDCSQVP